MEQTAGWETCVPVESPFPRTECAVMMAGPRFGHAATGRVAHAPEIRTATMVRYFMMMAKPSVAAQAAAGAADVADLLTHSPPLRVHLDVVDVVDLSAGMVNGRFRSCKELLSAGFLVGLCVGSSMECVGIGFVHSVDPVRREAFVLTPVPLSVCQRVTCIAMGALVPPSCFFRGTADVERRPFLAEHSLAAEGSGSGVMKSGGRVLLRGRAADV